jgi:four helix bundle protein
MVNGFRKSESEGSGLNASGDGSPAPFNRPHHRLEAWKISMDLVTEVYRLTASFPQDERYGLISQIRRAATSIPCNIAEGAARQTRKEFVQFLFMSRASAIELETQLTIARRLGFIAAASDRQVEAQLDRVIRLTSGLIANAKGRSSRKDS